MKIKMDQHDYNLIEEAMETTYASTVQQLIKVAHSEECKQQLRDILKECPE